MVYDENPVMNCYESVVLVLYENQPWLNNGL